MIEHLVSRVLTAQHSDLPELPHSQLAEYRISGEVFCIVIGNLVIDFGLMILSLSEDGIWKECPPGVPSYLIGSRRQSQENHPAQFFIEFKHFLKVAIAVLSVLDNEGFGKSP